MEDTRSATLHPRIYGNVETGSNLFTDTDVTYRSLGRDSSHQTVYHAEVYVVGQVHTNGQENFWSPLKRGLRTGCCSNCSSQPAFGSAKRSASPSAT